MYLNASREWSEMGWGSMTYMAIQSVLWAKHHKREPSGCCPQVCVFMWINSGLAFISSSTTLYLLSNFAAAWSYKISHPYVWLRNLRSIVKPVTQWPKAHMFTVRTKHINALSCVSENQSKVMHQQTANHIQPTENPKTKQTTAEKCTPVRSFIFLTCRCLLVS